MLQAYREEGWIGPATFTSPKTTPPWVEFLAYLCHKAAEALRGACGGAAASLRNSKSSWSNTWRLVARLLLDIGGWRTQLQGPCMIGGYWPWNKGCSATWWLRRGRLNRDKRLAFAPSGGACGKRKHGW